MVRAQVSYHFNIFCELSFNEYLNFLVSNDSVLSMGKTKLTMIVNIHDK